MDTYTPDPEIRKAQRAVRRAAKDPNKPKGAVSSYLYYANSVRDAVREKNPDKPMPEINKMIGDAWKGLSAADKKPFEKMAMADKKRYQREMEAYAH